MMNEIPKVSPVEQDFIWVSEYMDGSYLSEFDFHTKTENNYYDIQRQKLLRYSLVGHNMKLSYEIFGGYFNLAGKMIEVVYKVGDKEYWITGQQKMYNDLISYKDAEAAINLMGSNGGVTSTITQFNFGYKTELEIDDVKFNFKAICKLPFNQPIYLNFWLVADQDLDGVFQIRRNGRVVEEIKAPLTADVGGEINWIIQ